MLQIKNLSKKFNDKVILDNLFLEIPTGTIGIVLGASGTGKSTLLRTISGLEKYDTGTIFLDADYLKPERVGMVFQQFNLFENLTAHDNIIFALNKGRTAMPLEQATHTASALLKQYQMSDLADRFPNELSGGQQQRLAILRTIAQKPAVICFDEPTSAVDPLLKTDIAHTITQLAQQGYTILVATHDIQLVEQVSGRIFLMRAGAIVEHVDSQEYARAAESFPEIKKFMYHR